MHWAADVPCGASPLDRLRGLRDTSWGSYVAFAFGQQGDHRAVVDPSGAGRAFLVQDPDLTIITDMLYPGLMCGASFEIAVDHQALAGCLLDPGTMVTAPLLRGVTAMVPGTAHILTPGGPVTDLLSPALVDCYRDADGQQLRAAVDLAVGRVIGGDVDELGYAHATASRCGIPLHHGRTEAYPNYATLMEAEQVAHPYMYGVDDAFAGVISSAITDHIGDIVTGQGGDAVFFQPPTPLTTIDRVRDLGLRSGWHTLIDDAKRTWSSIWHHLMPALADRFDQLDRLRMNSPAIS